MERSHTETEIKLRYESAARAREALEALGAVVTRGRLFEDNVLWDRDDDALKRTGRMLRLRRAGDDATLTFKAPVEGEHRHKVRVEDESSVGDAAAVERMLAALGFAPRYRYQKFRTEYAWEGARLCLDETPIGCFVEIEGSPEKIDRAAALLGKTRGDHVVETYRDLHERAAAARGEPAGDLVFDERVRERA